MLKYHHEYMFTFAYLHSAAEWALRQAETSAAGSLFSSMHSILASVHCIEAFANHIGPRYFGNDWDTREKKLSTPNEKIRALLRTCRIDLKVIRPAYDTYMLGLRIRNALTHGRTHEVVTGGSVRFVGSVVSKSYPEWRRCCEPKTARKVFDSVTSIVERIAEASGEHRLIWGVLGGGFGWETAKEDQP